MGNYGAGNYGAGIYPGTDQATEFRKFSVRPFILVELQFSSGTKYLSQQWLRYSNIEYEGKILSLSTIRRSMQRNLGLYEISSVTLEVADTDQVFSSIAEPIKGTPVSIKLITAALGFSEAKTLLLGKIDDYTAENFKVTFVIKDTFLDLPEYPTTGFVDETSFPNAFKEVRGMPLPICYGTHSVTSDEDNRNRGAWPTLYVDNSTDAKKFLIAAHAVKAINEVYVNKPTTGSTLLTITTHYTTFPAGTLNGQTMAWIQFTNSQFTSNVVDTGGVVGQVRVNVQGKEDIGNGSGTLITNPIDVLLDFLANYCGNPVIDGASMTATEATATSRGYIVKGGYTEKKQTQTVLGDFVRSFNMMLFLTSDGKIGSHLVDSTALDAGGLLFDEARDIFKGSWSIDRASQIEGADDAQLINSIDYSFDFHYGRGGFFRSAQVSDSDSISLHGEKSLVLEMPWISDSSAASDVAQRIILQFKNAAAHASFITSLKGTLPELSERFLLSHANGPDGVAWSEQPMQLLESSFNPSDFSTTIRGRDISAIIGVDLFILGDEA